MLTRDVYDEAFRATARTFVDRHLLDRQEEFADLHGRPRDVWLEAGTQGLLGLQVPERFGGGVAAHSRGQLTAVDAAKAKWWSAEIQNEILDACVHLHGGYGHMAEYRVARAWADARVTRIWAGSNEIMKLLIARDLGL